MTTIRSTLASGIHQVTSGEIAELNKPIKDPMPLPPLEQDGKLYPRTLFPFQSEKTISVLRPNDAQKTELKDTPALFTEFLQHAVDVNKAYFVVEPRPPSGTIEHRRYASRLDAFTREANTLARQLYFPGPSYAGALDAIDAACSNLTTAIHGELTWGHHPTLNNRMKLLVGDASFAGYDEQIFMPRGEGIGGSLSRRYEAQIGGRHLSSEALLRLGAESIDWGPPPAGYGKKEE
jgi:hypothetical protein